MGHDRAGRRVWTILAAAVLATPAACQRGGEVTVAEAGGRMTVSVALVSDRRPACIDDLSIFTADGVAPLWHVAAAPGAPCVSQLVVGHEPAMFAPDEGTMPPLLSPGRAYRVEVSGKGFVAATRFVAGRAATARR